MVLRRSLLLLAAALCLAAPQGAAQARQRDQDHDRARAALARGEILPLARILSIAAGRVPGDVIKVKLDEERGQFTYEIRVLGKDGRVREIEVNARTGAILRVENN